MNRLPTRTPDILIHVGGARGVGKTTVAIQIVRVLRLAGYRVAYEGFSARQSAEIAQQIAGQPLDVSSPRNVAVFDSDPPALGVKEYIVAGVAGKKVIHAGSPQAALVAYCKSHPHQDPATANVQLLEHYLERHEPDTEHP